MEKLFVYGTLREPEVQKKVFGRVIALHDDILEGYEKQTVEINGNIYPIAVPNSQQSIEGKLLEATPDEIILMDEYETEAYQRKKVQLKSGEASWVYCQPETSP